MKGSSRLSLHCERNEERDEWRITIEFPLRLTMTSLFAPHLEQRCATIPAAPSCDRARQPRFRQREASPQERDQCVASPLASAVTRWLCTSCTESARAQEHNHYHPSEADSVCCSAPLARGRGSKDGRMHFDSSHTHIQRRRGSPHWQPRGGGGGCAFKTIHSSSYFAGRGFDPLDDYRGIHEDLPYLHAILLKSHRSSRRGHGNTAGRRHGRCHWSHYTPFRGCLAPLARALPLVKY